MKKKVLLVDELEIMKIGLSLIFKQEKSFELVAYAQNGSDAISAMEIYKPDIVIIDYFLKNENVIKVCKKIISKSPKTKVVFFVSFNDDEFILEALKAGASGYLLKEIDSKE